MYLLCPQWCNAKHISSTSLKHTQSHPCLIKVYVKSTQTETWGHSPPEVEIILDWSFPLIASIWSLINAIQMEVLKVRGADVISLKKKRLQALKNSFPAVADFWSRLYPAGLWLYLKSIITLWVWPLWFDLFFQCKLKHTKMLLQQTEKTHAEVNRSIFRGLEDLPLC